jgi:hypothetical protein
MFCIQCGARNPDNATFCGICGMRLEKGASPPPVNVVNQPVTPMPEVPLSGSAQSLPGEYGPITGAQVFQAPPTYPTSDPYSPVEMFSIPPPAYTGQASATGQAYPPISQTPASQPNLAPDGFSNSPTGPLPVIRKPWYKALPRPLPLWAFIGSIVAVVLLFVVLLLTGSDWAAGAAHVGIVAGILALVITLVTGVRILLGMAAKSNPKRVIQLVSAGLSILLLLLLCLVGLTQQSTIHSLQAHNWEGQQQWQSSINEYQMAGEGTPTSENIARVYNEWGEQFNAQQYYQDAIARFNIVMNNYGSASTGVARARSDTVKAYLAWGQQASQQHDYAAATSHYDALLQLTYCTATCQSQGTALDATAYYNLAESQFAVQHYADAVNNFQILVYRFPSSPEVQKIHVDYAKALFGHGKEQIASATCSNAVPTYQQLSTHFGDTPEGQQATSALKAPQPVKGHFTGTIPNSPSLTRVAALMKGLYTGISPDQFVNLFYSSPRTTIANDGSFVFGPQPQGSYELAWGTIVNATGAGLLTWNTSRYIANVGPLCPYNFGDIAENIPAAQ